MLKKLLIATIGLSLPLIASADDWVRADNTGAEEKGYHYAICYYKTSSYSNFPDYSFSITIEGSKYSCPSYIEYNPTTGKWRR
ncbi:hypothetical protein E4T80_02265 [Muribacter muris]|uniref:Uncharacterized protein n=1 Tax=Muribacter muris TaxID=67855 RepID=A0A4Y9K7F4_9PAST|nr:hypothetical protein [Muribacter muris]MBF0784303.1 hypothetical protein [Muribacter muris]MBF0826960.1 hypothetical protein [Muribacter muris]TFV13040.1 hypothetical protein E4T80_02265 [Muribacter muris]